MKIISTAFALIICASIACADDHPNFLKKILKVEDLSSPSAVVPLEEMLRKGGSSIHPCAAAQALFLMDTPEAKTILKKWLRFPHYNMDYSIRLTSHWGMDPIKRNQFIREYHLNSSSDDVEISVTALPVANGKSTIEFTISLKNTSDKFKVYARYHWEVSKDPSFDNIWTGRVVSKPIEIEIPKFSEPIKFPQLPDQNIANKAYNVPCRCRVTESVTLTLARGEQR